MMVGQNGKDLDSSFHSCYITAAYLVSYTELSPLLTGRTLSLLEETPALLCLEHHTRCLLMIKVI